MNDAGAIRSLKKIRHLPQMLAELAAEDEARRARRSELLAQMAQAGKTFERTDSDFAARIEPLERKIAEQRTALSRLEAEHASLLTGRQSAQFVAAGKAREFKAALRREVEQDIVEFQREIEELRAEASGNPNGRRAIVLGSFAKDLPPQSRIERVLQRLLDAHRLADEIALTEVDVPDALRRLRAELAAEGIGFLSAP